MIIAIRLEQTLLMSLANNIRNTPDRSKAAILRTYSLPHGNQNIINQVINYSAPIISR